MAKLNSIEVPSIASGTYESLTLPTAGTYFIKPRYQKYTLTGRLSEGADSFISQEGVGLNVKVSQADAPLTIYLQADCAENTTAKADYSDCFFEVGAEGEGGGGGGTTYSFSAPLQVTGGNVNLNLASDLQVKNGNLSLKLSGNQEFVDISNSIPTLQTKESARFAFTSQKIFTQGSPIAGFENITNNPYFRIPAMCISPKTGTWFCFMDYRASASDQVGIETAVARSKNGGYDWDYKKAVTREGTNTNSRVMDSTCLATKSGKVFVLVGSWSSGTTNWTQVSSRDTTWKAMLAVSTDDGDTWTQAEVQFTTANPLPANVNAFLGGVGAGIEMNNGTLVFPVQFTKARGTVSSGLIWSSDDGATWNWGTGFVDGVSENMIFETLDGNLVCVGRKDPNTGNSRASYITTDMGVNWTPYDVLNNRISAPSNAGCQGSSIFFVTKKGVPVLLMTAPQNRRGGYYRDRITLYASNNTYGSIKEVFVLNYDAGATMQGSSTPFGGYSCLSYYAGVDGERLLCFFEDGLGGRLTDLTPLIAELENLYTNPKEISLLETIDQQLNTYSRDQLLTEYSINGFNEGIWIDTGNWLPLNVLSSRHEVTPDPNFAGMIKFANSTTAGGTTNYVDSHILSNLDIINTPNVSFDFDLVIPTSQISSASNYINIFITNDGTEGNNYTYGLLFAKNLSSGNIVLNPVGSWGNGSTFTLPGNLQGTKIHITMVYTNTSCKVYVNGNTTPMFSTTFSSSTYLQHAKRLIMGNSQKIDKIGEFSLGNFKIYTKELSVAEVTQNYNASIAVGASQQWIKSQVKDIVAQSTDFNDFKTRIQNW